MPDLTVVIDHLGKAQLELDAGGVAATEGQFRQWERSLQEIAEYPSVVGKLSGLDAALAAGVTLKARAIAPVVDVALRAFGADRLMFGGDWPVSLGRTSYANLAAEVRAALAGLSDHERAAVLHGTAQRVYDLGPT